MNKIKDCYLEEIIKYNLQNENSTLFKNENCEVTYVSNGNGPLSKHFKYTITLFVKGEMKDYLYCNDEDIIECTMEWL